MLIPAPLRTLDISFITGITTICSKTNLYQISNDFLLLTYSLLNTFDFGHKSNLNIDSEQMAFL